MNQPKTINLIAFKVIEQLYGFCRAHVVLGSGPINPTVDERPLSGQSRLSQKYSSRPRTGSCRWFSHGIRQYETCTITYDQFDLWIALAWFGNGMGRFILFCGNSASRSTSTYNCTPPRVLGSSCTLFGCLAKRHQNSKIGESLDLLFDHGRVEQCHPVLSHFLGSNEHRQWPGFNLERHHRSFWGGCSRYFAC